MRNIKRILLFSGSYLLLVWFISCNRDTVIAKSWKDDAILKQELNLPAQPFHYANQALPDYFKDQFITIQNNTPANNQITDWGATLGRVLFYDTRLSFNHQISCASCHKQAFGFADTAQFSKGFKGGLTGRHSMSLINAGYYSNGRFFWDERASSLEDQVLLPIQDLVEMGMTLDSVVSRLRATDFYPILFKRAFGTEEIDVRRASFAMAQFVRSMISYQSKFDEGRTQVKLKTDDFPNYTAEENRGKKIFMTHQPISCSGCHTTDLFILDNPRNNGTTITNKDIGIAEHTKSNLDEGKFKSPSLKNLALRKRFMHDGSVVGLDELINHYDKGILANPNLDPHLLGMNGQPLKMNFTASEILALKAFLITLTDDKIIVDEKFSSPFK